MKVTIEQALECMEEAGINVLNEFPSVEKKIGEIEDLTFNYRIQLPNFQSILDDKKQIKKDKIELPLAQKFLKLVKDTTDSVQILEKDIQMLKLSECKKIKKYFDPNEELSLLNFVGKLDEIKQKINEIMDDSKKDKNELKSGKK